MALTGKKALGAAMAYTDTVALGQGAVQGPQGPPGPQGIPGATGAQGLQGIPGVQGIQGIPGEKGDTGEQGIQGVPGEQGIPGQNGADGAGISINGSVQTYADLPTDLTSADAGKSYIVTGDGLLYIWDGSAFPNDGDGIQFQGPPGPQGEQGIQGIQGIQGEPGNDGAPGADGQQGIQGVMGEQGEQGPPGIQGIQGIQGPQGEQGVAGPPGNINPRGVWSATVDDYTQYDVVTFDDGTNNHSYIYTSTTSGDMTAPNTSASWALFVMQGPRGIQGIQGVQGEQGVQGIQGEQGEVGPAGTPNPNANDSARLGGQLPSYYQTALTSQQLSNIAAVPSKKNNFAYSTTETLTGDTWIDGKPIYRIAKQFVSSEAEGMSVAGPVDTLISVTGSWAEIYSGGGAYTIYPLYAGTTSSFEIYLDSVYNYLYIQLEGSSTRSIKVLVVAEYTKP